MAHGLSLSRHWVGGGSHAKDCKPGQLGAPERFIQSTTEGSGTRTWGREDLRCASAAELAPLTKSAGLRPFSDT